MNNFEFVHGGRELLDYVQPLWEKLNKHHEVSSQFFSDRFKNNIFHIRKRKFIDDLSLKVNIDLIKDNEKEIYIGYCISTINDELAGEIDSIFVKKEYRKLGLGGMLMDRALESLNANNVRTKVICVAEGNDSVLEFYKRYGFYKRRIILEQIK